VHVTRQKVGFSFCEGTLDCGDSSRQKLVMESQVVDGLHEGIISIPLTVRLRQIAFCKAPVVTCEDHATAFVNGPARL